MSQTFKPNCLLHFFPEEWEKFKPPQEIHDRNDLKNVHSKTVMRLKAGAWTDIFSRSIWLTTKLPCCWKFLYNFVATTSNPLYFIQAGGKCIDCNCKLFLYVKNSESLNPTAHGITINCVIYGNDPQNHKHTHKRQLAGERRREICKQMLEQRELPMRIRRILSQENTEFFEKKPSRYHKKSEI